MEVATFRSCRDSGLKKRCAGRSLTLFGSDSGWEVWLNLLGDEKRLREFLQLQMLLSKSKPNLESGDLTARIQ